MRACPGVTCEAWSVDSTLDVSTNGNVCASPHDVYEKLQALVGPDLLVPRRAADES